MKYSIIYLALLFLFSCRNGDNNIGSIPSDSANLFVKSNDSIEDKDPPNDPEDGYYPNPDEVVFPLDFELKTYYIEPGTYHDTDELSKIKRKGQWLGCFKNASGEIELKSVQVNFKRVFDEMMDVDKRKPSGIEPIISEAVNCEFVINSIGGMKPKMIVSLIPDYNEFQLGDLATIKSENATYKVYTTGQKVIENEQEGIREFKLFLTEISKNGEKKNQLLIQVPTFGEYGPPVIRVVLAAYLDEDSIPDFIISNENSTYVYLSSFASESQIVKVVGSDVLPSGC